jgi:hypothetical protein
MAVASSEPLAETLRVLQVKTALLTDAEGAVLLRAGVAERDAATELEIQKMAATYVQTAEQAGKLGLGKNTHATAFYGAPRLPCCAMDSSLSLSLSPSLSLSLSPSLSLSLSLLSLSSLSLAHIAPFSQTYRALSESARQGHRSARQRVAASAYAARG